MDLEALIFSYLFLFSHTFLLKNTTYGFFWSSLLGGSLLKVNVHWMILPTTSAKATP